MGDPLESGNGQVPLLELTLPAQYRYLGLVRACIREMMEAADGKAVAEDVLYGMQLAVHEICNNIIEHAYGNENGTLRLVLRVFAKSRIFTTDLYDSGKKFNPALVVPPDLDEPREEGYGLFLAHQLMDEVTYDCDSGHNHWRLVKKY